LTAVDAQGEQLGHLQEDQNLWQSYPKVAGKLPLSYEVVYGQAWRGEHSKKSGEQVISLQQLKEQLQGKK
jgi:hypothetical protein